MQGLIITISYLVAFIMIGAIIFQLRQQYITAYHPNFYIMIGLTATMFIIIKKLEKNLPEPLNREEDNV